MDFTPWNRLLQEYVNDQGRIDYGRWQKTSMQPLDQWLENMGTVRWQELNDQGAIALLVNLYNALTIRQVLQRYPIESIRPDLLRIPNWIAFVRFFSRDLYTLNGERLSLNDIEHNLLRKRFSEPRIHFALVCASVGCPLLRSQAYWPDRAFAQLEEDAHRFINNPDKVHYNPDSNMLHCSKIFKWYEADFLKVAESIAAYIHRYRPEIPLSDNLQISYLPYSWQLNQRMSS